MLVDLLADWPGLNPQPPLDSSGHAQLVRELTFALGPCQTEAECEPVMIRVMVSRGFWPLGTRYVNGRLVFPRRRRAA